MLSGSLLKANRLEMDYLYLSHHDLLSSSGYPPVGFYPTDCVLLGDYGLDWFRYSCWGAPARPRVPIYGWQHYSLQRASTNTSVSHRLAEDDAEKPTVSRCPSIHGG